MVTKKNEDQAEREDNTEYSVTSETYSEEEERFKNEHIKTDTLYRSYRKYCHYSAVMKELRRKFSKRDNSYTFTEWIHDCGYKRPVRKKVSVLYYFFCLS